jgi:hypothetical protein
LEVPVASAVPHCCAAVNASTCRQPSAHAEKDHATTIALQARLSATLRWRREHRPEQQICTCCQADPRSHYFHPVGFTRRGHPVLYSCLALANDRSQRGNREHMIQTFEQAVRLMPAGIERWVWFSDLSGFAMRDLQPVRAPGPLPALLYTCLAV